MAQKKAVVVTGSFLLVLMVLVGFLSLAADAGSSEDPMVTLSYLNGLEPKLQEAIDRLTKEKVDTLNADFDKKVADAKEEIAKLISQSGGSVTVEGGSYTLTDEDIQAIVNEVMGKLGNLPGSSGTSVTASSTYTRVEVAKGKTVTFGIGSTFYLRTGTATVYKDKEPGLIDLTDGNTLDSGDVKPNHLYSVTFDHTKGFTVTKDAIFFIQGSYKVK